MLNRTFLIYIITGLILGVISAFSKGTLFVIFLAGFILYCIRRFATAQDRKFLTLIFIAGFLIRIFATLLQDGGALFFFPHSMMQEIKEPKPVNDSYANLIHENTRTFFKISDSDYASARGYIYSAYAKGMDNIVIRHYFNVDKEYGWSGYLYIIGVFYYLFGYSPIAVKFINCLLGVLTALFLYLIGINFNRSVAKVACALAVFYPSLVLWSTTNLKDIPVGFLSVVLLWQAIKFLKNKKVKYLSGILICLFLQYFLTLHQLWMLSIVSLVLISLIYFLRKLKRKYLILILLVTLFILFPTQQKEIIGSKFRGGIYKLLVLHTGFVNTEGVNYKILDEHYYQDPWSLENIDPPIFLEALLKGLFHFFFEPLPIRISNYFFLATFPQMLLWYLLIPFGLIGIFIGFKTDYVSTIVILTYLAMFTVALSLFSGNVGTLLRHRDMVTPFYFIFMALGLNAVLKLKTGEF